MKNQRRIFGERLAKLTSEAIDATQAAIADEFDRRYGTLGIVSELRLYADNLAGYTMLTEECGDLRPLRQLLTDAAQTISISAAAKARSA